MRKLLGALLALTMVATACGGDDDGGSAFGGGGGGDFCAIAERQDALETSFDDGSLNIFEPESAEQAFRELEGLIDEAAGSAPEEIRGDFEILQGEFENVLAALEEADFNLAQVDQSAIEQSAEAEAASDRIEAFVEETCGISADDDISEGPSDEQLQEQLEESGNADQFIAAALEQAGLPADQAQCVASQITVDELIAAGESGEPPAEFLQILEGCGVSPEQLAALGAAAGGLEGGDVSGEVTEEGAAEDVIEDMPLEELTGGELPEGALDIFVQQFVAQGFTEDEARCLGQFFVDGGSDPFEAFEACGISLSRIAEIGG